MVFCMRARLIDPRDARSEDVAPTYRVLFWANATTCEEWELTATDLDDALSWISSNAAGRTHSLWAATGADEQACIVRLRGVDPPAPAGAFPLWAAEMR